MKKLIMGLFVLALLPLPAQAEDREDRGERYRDWGRRHHHREYREHRDHHKHRDSRFELSIGFGTHRHHSYDHAQLHYSSGYRRHHYPYYRERIIVERPVYVPPARVYIYEPAHCYTPPYTYSETHYYYGR